MTDTPILPLSATTAAQWWVSSSKRMSFARSVIAVAVVITAAVAAVMTKNVTYFRPGDLLKDVWSIIKERSLLHVPIVGEDFRPLGVINAWDALLALLEGAEY
jgi:CBS domain-containing protein